MISSVVLQAMLAPVIKPSESRFKPLFADLAEWGGSLPACAAGPLAMRPQHAAARGLRLCSRLSHALRSVSAPFFQNLLDTMCDSHVAEPHLVAPSRKKQEASKAAEASAHNSNREALLHASIGAACMTHRVCHTRPLRAVLRAGRASRRPPRSWPQQGKPQHAVLCAAVVPHCYAPMYALWPERAVRCGYRCLLQRG